MAVLKNKPGGKEDKNESELREIKKELQKGLQDLQEENKSIRKLLRQHADYLSSLESLLDGENTQALEERCARLEMQKKGLEKKISEIEGMGKKLLLDRFTKLQEDLREIRSCEPYAELFKKIAGPLQILIGLEEAADSLSDDKKEYYMWDRVAEPLIRAIEDSRAEYEEGELILPSRQMEQYGKTIENKIEKAKEMDCEELEQWIKEEESRKTQGKIIRQERKIVRDLTDEIIRPIEAAWEMKAEGKFDWEQKRNQELPVRLAAAARNILKCNGIWPMFVSDKRLKEYPGRGEFFTPLKENAIRYPGLLIEYGGKWEVLGERLGMDTWEDADFPEQGSAATGR